jgi:hypothetical protein
MKLSTIFVGALATLVTAAPAKVEEEKRSSGFGSDSFGSGFGSDAFGLGGAASLGSGLGFFGQANVLGNVFDQGLLGSFNSFDVLNPNVAFLLGNNGFDFNALFTIFDLSLGVNSFQNIFTLGAGNFIDVNTLLQVQTALTFQWLLNSFGSQLFFQQSFGGFGGVSFPQLNFGGLEAAGLGLGTQILINNDLLDLNSFNQFGSGFIGGAGLNALSGFNFANLGIQGSVFLKE